MLIRTGSLLALTLLMLSQTGCGWQLRGYEGFRQNGDRRIESVALDIQASGRLFQATVEKQLNDLSIAVDENAEKRLLIHEEQSEKRPLSFSSTGIPIQYQLTMTTRFSVQKEGEFVIKKRRYIARRQFDFDTALVVAKKEEEQQLLQEMREELASRIIATLVE